MQVPRCSNAPALGRGVARRPWVSGADRTLVLRHGLGGNMAGSGTHGGTLERCGHRRMGTTAGVSCSQRRERSRPSCSRLACGGRDLGSRIRSQSVIRSSRGTAGGAGVGFPTRAQSSGLPAVLLNGAVVFAAALALFFCAAGATTLFDDPNVARERAKQRKAEKRLRRQGRPWVIPCPPGRRGTERHRVVRRG